MTESLKSPVYAILLLKSLDLLPPAAEPIDAKIYPYMSLGLKSAVTFPVLNAIYMLSKSLSFSY